jgi:hypothetical protein
MAQVEDLLYRLLLKGQSPFVIRIWFGRIQNELKTQLIWIKSRNVLPNTTTRLFWLMWYPILQSKWGG